MGGFELEKYHRFADSGPHAEVVRQTRDLFPEDFGFDVATVHQRLGEIVGFDLTDIDPSTGSKLHIIVRVNRPNSNDFNPVHKDIYEAFDQRGRVPKFINFWIPICGVNENSSLPIAPGSHLINENLILRYPAGSVIQGRQYRVSNIVNWAGRSELVRPRVSNGSVLVFSSHLIHGLAKNYNEDVTRVAWAVKSVQALSRSFEGKQDLSDIALRFVLSFNECSVVIPGIRTDYPLDKLISLLKRDRLKQSEIDSILNSTEDCYSGWA